MDHDVYWDSYASDIVKKFNNLYNNEVKHYYLTIEEEISNSTASNKYCSAANDKGACTTWVECPNGGKIDYKQTTYKLQRCTSEDDCENITSQSDLTKRPIYNVSTSSTGIRAYKIPDLSCINKTIVEVKKEDDCYKKYLDTKPSTDKHNDEDNDRTYDENETFTDNTGTYILTGNTNGKCFINQEKKYCDSNSSTPECLSMTE